MNRAIRLYRQFDRWFRALSRTQRAIFVGMEFFVIWVGLDVLFGGLPLIATIFGAFGSALAIYYFDPQ
jgi:hypothetical protein